MTTTAIATAETRATQYLTFLIEDEEYAVDILRVKEILPYKTVTKVPTTPSFIRGVINIRGNVVPVVDLGIKFGLGERAITKLSCTVIVEVDVDDRKAVMGMLVDSVSEVMELPAEDIVDPPSFGTRVRVDCLLGMGKVGSDKHFVLLLDIDRVLGSDDLLVATSLEDDASTPHAPGKRDSARRKKRTKQAKAAPGSQAGGKPGDKSVGAGPGKSEPKDVPVGELGTKSQKPGKPEPKDGPVGEQRTKRAKAAPKA